LAEFTVRPARQADFAAIRELIGIVRINPTGLDWRRFVVALTTTGEFAACGQLKPHGDGSLELASIAVVPPFRGQGAARAVIATLLQGSPRPLYLMCRAKLGPFYEKFGFSAIGPDEMPPYFRRIHKLTRFFRPGAGEDGLLVMRLL
jgi:N-acetylglutamate synthase-like GNAT family acetyltransferase